jgi:RHS repeat-associated protein
MNSLVRLVGGAIAGVAFAPLSAWAGVTVTLTSPANNATFGAPATIALAATASATGGYSVSKVEFFNGATLIGTDTSAPYSFTWNNVSVGSYTLTAKATAIKSGSPTQTATSAVANVTVTTPVSITLTAPANTLFAPPASIGLAASATTAQGYAVSKVEFFSGSTLLGTVTSSPYTFNWTNVPQGNYFVTAKATATKSGSSDASATSSPKTIAVTTPPTVNITSPAEGALLGAPYPGPIPVTVNAVASDSDGTISAVTFNVWEVNTVNLAGTTTVTVAPYSAVFSVSPTPGNVCPCFYTIEAIAYDNQGVASPSALISVLVGFNTPPSVSITSPAANAVLSAPATTTVSAQATDVDDSVTQVAFYANGLPIGVSTTAPFSVPWTNVQQGNYLLTAVATNTFGASTASAPVPVTVTGSTAKLFFIQTDHLNTPRAIEDSNQQLRWRWDQQEPFGASVPDENPAGQGTFEFPQRFPGQYTDKDTNLRYNLRRDYDSALGRYVQSDPKGLSAGINPYVYVLGDPLMLRDPKGLELECADVLDGFVTRPELIKIQDEIGGWQKVCGVFPNKAVPGIPDPFEQELKKGPGGFPGDIEWDYHCDFRWVITQPAIFETILITYMRHHIRCVDKCPPRVVNIGPIYTPIDVALP